MHHRLAAVSGWLLAWQGPWHLHRRRRLCRCLWLLTFVALQAARLRWTEFMHGSMRCRVPHIDMCMSSCPHLQTRRLATWLWRWSTPMGTTRLSCWPRPAQTSTWAPSLPRLAWCRGACSDSAAACACPPAPAGLRLSCMHVHAACLRAPAGCAAHARVGTPLAHGADAML